MRFLIFMFTSFILMSAQTVLATSENFDLANEAYSKGQYAKAVELYEKLIVDNGHSASVYFNLANSYAQLQENGKAVLNYRRGLLLDPGNSDLIKNYDYFTKEAGLFLDEQPTLEKFIYTLTINQWSGLTLFCLICLSLTVVFWRKISAGSLARGVGNVLLFSFLTAGSAFATATLYKDWQKHVVISDVKLLVSPFDNSESKGLIKAGRLATIGKEYKNYVHIETETGQSGWVNKDNMQAIQVE